jgi:hypothetical protein
MARQQLLHLTAALLIGGVAGSPAQAQSVTAQAQKVAAAALAAQPAVAEEAPEAPRPLSLRQERPQWLTPMHVATVTMQVLDAHSTYRAIHDAHIVEANPLMRSMAEKPATLVAVKAGVAAAIVYSTEKLARRHRVAAFVSALAVNSAYAMLVAHNYSLAARNRAPAAPR